MKSSMMIATAFAVLTALAEVTISGVSARQRWPWNNLVDVDFTVNDAPLGESYAVQVSAAYGKGLGTAIAKTFETEPIATGGVNRLVWNLGADYPDLKADGQMARVMEELTSTENRIAFARQSYNDSVTEYNTKRELFPTSIIAGIFNFAPAALLESTESAAQRETPQVKF